MKKFLFIGIDFSKNKFDRFNYWNVYQPASKEIDALQLLTAHRSRLVKNKVQLQVSSNEMRRVINETARWIFESARLVIKPLLTMSEIN